MRSEQLLATEYHQCIFTHCTAYVRTTVPLYQYQAGTMQVLHGALDTISWYHTFVITLSLAQGEQVEPPFGSCLLHLARTRHQETLPAAEDGTYTSEGELLVSSATLMVGLICHQNQTAVRIRPRLWYCTHYPHNAVIPF